MTIWYDVSDLTTWTLPHLTGIQRTTVGILNGPRRPGHRAHSWFGSTGTAAEFVPLEVGRTAGRRPAASAPGSPQPRDRRSAASRPPASRGPRRRPPAGGRSGSSAARLIFGTSPAAAELRQAFREFKHASRHLRKRLSRWAGVRFFRGSPPLPAFRAGHRRRRADAAACPCPPGRPPGRSAPGDVLLSLGSLLADRRPCRGRRRPAEHGVPSCCG